MLAEDAGRGGAEHARRCHELPLSQRQHLSPEQARRVEPGEQDDHENDRPDVAAEHRRNGDREQEEREGRHDVHQARDHAVGHSPHIARDQAHQQRHDHREGGGHHADEEGRPSAVAELHEHVVPTHVGRTQHEAVALADVADAIAATHRTDWQQREVVRASGV